MRIEQIAMRESVLLEAMEERGGRIAKLGEAHMNHTLERLMDAAQFGMRANSDVGVIRADSNMTDGDVHPNTPWRDGQTYECSRVPVFLPLKMLVE